MNKIKKLGLILFVMFVVINLQLNTPLTEGMHEGFSLAQLVDNIFVPSALAEEGEYVCTISMPCDVGPPATCTVYSCAGDAGCWSEPSHNRVVCECGSARKEVYCMQQ